MTAAGALRLERRVEDQAVSVRRPQTPGERLVDIHLAQFLLRPVDFVDAVHWRALSLSPQVVGNMNRAMPFRRSVNAALGDLTFGPIELDATALTALRETREGRLCAFLLIAPIGAVERAARFVGAAVLSKRITQLLLAADRRAAREEMGDDAFEFAIGEAPLMCPDLTSLTATMTAPANAPFADIARALLVDLVGQIAPALERLFQLRFPPSELPAVPPRFSPVHLSQAMRLIMRKEPAWLAFID